MLGPAHGNTEQCHTSALMQITPCPAGQLGVWMLLHTFPRLFGGSSEGSSGLCVLAGEGLTALTGREICSLDVKAGN